MADLRVRRAGGPRGGAVGGFGPPGRDDRGVVPYSEGCLSLPGITGDVNRPATVTMEAMNPDGETVRLAATGLLARCWQHEIDHLDGVLILDRMTQTSRLKNRSRVKAMERAGRR